MTAESVQAVYSTRGTADLVHLYVHGYVPPVAPKRPRSYEAPLCGTGTTTGTTKAPRELGTPKALQEPYRWCAVCVGRYLEHSGRLSEVMAPIIRREQARADS